MHSELLFQASDAELIDSPIRAFRSFLEGRRKLSFGTYREMHQWSIDHLGEFWFELSEFFGLGWALSPETALVWEPGESMRKARWFPQAKINYAEILLSRLNPGLALVSIREDGTRQSFSSTELRQLTLGFQRKLMALGLKKGDIVAGVLTNDFQAVVASLACARQGLIWTSASPDFGWEALRDRFKPLRPKLLLASAQHCYAGKTLDHTETIKKLSLDLGLLSHTYVSGESGEALALPSFDSWFSSEEPCPQALAPRAELVPFDHPLWILFSSGTTGLPKAIIHSQGGSLLQHLKEHSLHCDLRPKDRLCFYTTTGWMMWQWSLSALASGVTLYTYEGSPAFPSLRRLWELSQNEGLSHLGLSPRLLAECQKNDLDLNELLLKSPLRMILSTGSPLLSAQFDYVYRSVKPDLILGSISGGTDIVSCFVLCQPELGVKRAKIQAKGLGMSVEIWNDHAQPCLKGEKGELVCTRPFPSMPVGFCNDPKGELFKAAYFSHYDQEVWHHGDYISEDEEGYLTIWGRSDATLNPSGVRIGTAELYRVIEGFREIDEAIISDYTSPDGESHIILCVKLRAPHELSAALEQAIKQALKGALSPRHVPRLIYPVKAIPLTRNGKKVELILRAIWAGKDQKELGALQNPSVLTEYNDLKKAIKAKLG